MTGWVTVDLDRLNTYFWSRKFERAENKQTGSTHAQFEWRRKTIVLRLSSLRAPCNKPQNEDAQNTRLRPSHTSKISRTIPY